MKRKEANKWAFLCSATVFLALCTRMAIELVNQASSGSLTTASGAVVGGLVLLTGAGTVFCVVWSKKYAYNN